MKVRNFSFLFIFALGILIMVLCAPKPAEPKVPSVPEIEALIMPAEGVEVDKTALATYVRDWCLSLKEEFEGEDPNLNQFARSLFKAGAIIEGWEEVDGVKKYKRKRNENAIKDFFRQFRRIEGVEIEFDIRCIHVDSIDEDITAEINEEEGRINLIARIIVKFIIITPNPGNQSVDGYAEALHREDCPWGDPPI